MKAPVARNRYGSYARCEKLLHGDLFCISVKTGCGREIAVCPLCKELYVYVLGQWIRQDRYCLDDFSTVKEQEPSYSTLSNYTTPEHDWGLDAVVSGGAISAVTAACM